MSDGIALTLAGNSEKNWMKPKCTTLRMSVATLRMSVATLIMSVATLRMSVAHQRVKSLNFERKS